MQAAEGSRTAALDAYARGAFADAALLFGRAVALLQVDYRPARYEALCNPYLAP